MEEVPQTQQKRCKTVFKLTIIWYFVIWLMLCQGYTIFKTWLFFYQVRLVECGCSTSPVQVFFKTNNVFSLIIIARLKLGTFDIFLLTHYCKFFRILCQGNKNKNVLFQNRLQNSKQATMSFMVEVTPLLIQIIFP